MLYTIRTIILPQWFAIMNNTGITLSLMVFIYLIHGVSMASDWNSVMNLTCGGEKFEIKARAFHPNEAGTCLVEEKYYWQGKELPAIYFENYYHNLKDFFPKSEMTDFGLNLNLKGLAMAGGSYEIGPSIFMDPELFSKASFESLSACIKANQQRIKNTYESYEIHKRFYIFLKCKGSLSAHGIARLIYAKPTIIDIYEHGADVIILDSKNQVHHTNNYTSNNPMQLTHVGSLNPTERSVHFNSQSLEKAGTKLEYLRPITNRSGKVFGKEWNLK